MRHLVRSFSALLSALGVLCSAHVFARPTGQISFDVKATLDANVKATVTEPVLEGLSGIGALVNVVNFFSDQQFRADTRETLSQIRAQLAEFNVRLALLDTKVEALSQAVQGLYPYIAQGLEKERREHLVAAADAALELATSAATDPQPFAVDLAAQTTSLTVARNFLAQSSYASNYMVVGRAMIAETAIRRLRLANNNTDAERRYSETAFEVYERYFQRAVDDPTNGLAAMQVSARAQWTAAASSVASISRPFVGRPSGPSQGIWVGGWGPNGITPTSYSCIQLVRVNGDLEDLAHTFELSGALSLQRTARSPAFPDPCNAGNNYLPDNYEPSSWKAVQELQTAYKTGRQIDGLTSAVVPQCRVLAQSAKRLADSFRK
jgi:hypothetical protein